MVDAAVAGILNGRLKLSYLLDPSACQDFSQTVAPNGHCFHGLGPDGRLNPMSPAVVDLSAPHLSLHCSPRIPLYLQVIAVCMVSATLQQMEFLVVFVPFLDKLKSFLKVLLGLLQSNQGSKFMGATFCTALVH